MATVFLALLTSAQASAPKDFNIQLELLRAGFGATCYAHGYGGRIEPWRNARLAGLTASYKRFRFGVSFLDFPPTGGSSILPVEAGLTIYQRPLRYGWFQGMVPDVFAEVGYYWANGIIEDNMYFPVWKFGVRSEVDYYGLGAGVEVAYCIMTRSGAGTQSGLGPAASLYVRLLVTNFGF